MPRMVEVTIDSVRVSLTNQQRIVVLREVNADRYLPIWIGPYEAEAITIALQEIEVARPQTHDLLKNVLNTLDARLTRVEVVALHDDVFYANLVVELMEGGPHRLTPLHALRWPKAHIPVLVARGDGRAGVVPEKDLAVTTKAATLRGRRTPGKESEERLSVFEDFLQNLDLKSPRMIG